VADDFWWEAVALKRYRSRPMILIGDQPQSYPSYRDIADPASQGQVDFRGSAHDKWVLAKQEGRPAPHRFIEVSPGALANQHPPRLTGRATQRW
jgi:hypothetical protein